MKPTLLVLAAGMGSRYGGLKQLDPMGPSGETLLDYSVFDALRAGFGRVVFVIRRDFQKHFREAVGGKFEGRTEVGYVFQELDELPGGFRRPAARQRPWGTGHAIWCARDEVNPFRRDQRGRFLRGGRLPHAGGFLRRHARHARHARRRGRTLRDGRLPARPYVVRAWVGRARRLRGRRPRQSAKSGGMHGHRACARRRPDPQPAAGRSCRGVHWSRDGVDELLGFHPRAVPAAGNRPRRFLRANRDDPKAEYYIPVAVAETIAAGTAQVRVLPTDAKWFGVTYREDKPVVAASLAELVRQGVYPADLLA